MKLPTASKLALVDECPPSWVLPHVRETHAAAEDGNDLHAVLKRAVLAAQGVCLGPCLTAREVGVSVSGNPIAYAHPDCELHSGVDVASPWLDAVLEVVGDRLNGAKAEAAYAYDVATGKARLLGCDLGRHYGQTETEVAGAADYVVDAGDVIEVWDLKTGLTPQDPLEHHAQMRALACAVGTTHDKPVRTMLLLAPRDGQKPRIVAGPTYGAFDLLELGEWLRGLAERIQRAQGSPDRNKRFSVGKWCAHCPARLHCPTQVAMIHRMATTPDDVAADLARGLALPETRRLAYNRLRAAEKALQWVRGQLHASMADLGPIDLGGGKVFGPHETTSEAFDPEIVWPWMAERFGVDAAKAAMTLKTSKTAISRVVGEHAPRGKKTAAVEAALAELRAIPGAVAVKHEVTTEEHSPRTLSAPPALADTTGLPPGPSSSALSPPGDNAAQETA